MVAFVISVMISVLLVAPIMVYARRRPIDAELTWGEAMVAATYVFFLLFWVYGVVPHQWLQWADSELTGAEAALDSPEGPRDAANRGARLLRQYVERRFSIQTEAFTTEELSAAKPPLAIDSRWPELVRILSRFDAERFRRSDVSGSARAGAQRGAHSGIRREIEAVKRFVADSTPHELRR